MEAAINAYPGMHGKVGTYLSTKLREALTGDPDTLTVRVYGNSLDVIRAKAEEIRASMAKIPASKIRRSSYRSKTGDRGQGGC